MNVKIIYNLIEHFKHNINLHFLLNIKIIGNKYLKCIL